MIATPWIAPAAYVIFRSTAVGLALSVPRDLVLLGTVLARETREARTLGELMWGKPVGVFAKQLAGVFYLEALALELRADKKARVALAEWSKINHPGKEEL